METVEKKALQGGEWLVRETDFQDVFTPEEWTEEQQMIAQTCRDFIAQEVTPNLDRIDTLEEGLMAGLMDKAGELGLLAITVPEQYGGMGASFNTSCLVAEATGSGHSFSVAISAHTGIGTLPLQYYGNAEQHAKYLPGLASGELKASYALTEPSAGSDANSGKTKATLSEDGKYYILNGQKMWITNAGFADLFTVFAKIDDDKNLSAFLVEATWEGVSLNAEEKKMGIKGSSTRQVFFNNVKVPVENLLSERGNGFKIAVNILNIGRIKLGAAAIGGGKQAITQSVNYANEREQFGRPISKYGAIRHKLAQQAILNWVNESATYRAGQDIENCIDRYIAEGMDPEQAKLKGVASYAVECAILKVFGSEAIDYIVDEAVQIYGGMGFSAESPVERAYRDARINRIFEGTNEINRMLTVNMMLQKAMKGELDLMGPAQKVAGELMSIPELGEEDNSLFGKEKGYLKNFKKAALMVAGSAAQKLAMSLAKEQEVLMNIADILIAVYTAESALLRAEKMVSVKGEAACGAQIDMVKVYFQDTADNIWKWGKDAISSYADGDELRMMNLGIKRFTKTEVFNAKEARRRIAQVIIDENKYPF
ncbi:MAG: acyl-CoA dehydrogenase family protein [Flavobacteriales bacterium]|nr:acyl-CoA dehydrogenase family protein [Flavobacteriales bacterium]MCB9205378.1 acyl-CoA dehydrogenase family protein [Flavobacteriales bacterium]